MHGKILYQAAVIAGDNMESAREFLDYLKSKDVKKMFAKGGIGE
jgi:accessory colonization factor AcfC